MYGASGDIACDKQKAVEHVLRVGKAVGGTIADFTEFDRKNYFYPDIPKGYQISQYKYPLVSGGKLAGVDITRVHLEEDTATSKHDKGDYSLVDYNRAGVPLMELVTEPVIHDAETAVWFAKELQLLLRYLGVSDANMEKGEMRVEANISISLKSNAESQKLGTKVEVKNLNSFKVVGKAIEYEIARQIKALETGEKLVQETRGWDENRGATFSQRKKESSDDYRYFPDPDLPKLRISEIAKFQDITLPELPRQKRERYARDYGIKAEDIESYVTDEKLGVFFELIAMSLKEKDLVVLASNYITSDLLGMRSAGTDIFAYITAEQFVALISMAGAGEISSRAAKDILGILVEKGGDPREIARREGLFQKSDEGELKAIAEKIIAENEKVVTEYKAGKEASLQFLVGQVMKETRGSANPQVAAKLLKEVLS